MGVTIAPIRILIYLDKKGLYYIGEENGDAVIEQIEALLMGWA